MQTRMATVSDNFVVGRRLDGRTTIVRSVVYVRRAPITFKCPNNAHEVPLRARAVPKNVSSCSISKWFAVVA